MDRLIHTALSGAARRAWRAQTVDREQPGQCEHGRLPRRDARRRGRLWVRGRRFEARAPVVARK